MENKGRILICTLDSKERLRIRDFVQSLYIPLGLSKYKDLIYFQESDTFFNPDAKIGHLNERDLLTILDRHTGLNHEQYNQKIHSVAYQMTINLLNQKGIPNFLYEGELSDIRNGTGVLSDDRTVLEGRLRHKLFRIAKDITARLEALKSSYNLK
ncbi:MAG TPA: hypothetical protein VMC07_03215 [Candidatus Omnitrophota bacterium]|nr:hypothetical protein [Candidatus Omnitrophota bacterium]